MMRKWVSNSQKWISNSLIDHSDSKVGPLGPFFSNPGDNPARMSTIQLSPMTNRTLYRYKRVESDQHADRGNATPINGWAVTVPL